MRNVNYILITAILMVFSFAAVAQQSQTVRCNFKTDSETISADDKAELDALAAKLKTAEGEIEIIVAGYTDSTGTDEYNNALAVRRAAAVYEYLVTQGLSENINGKALGQAVVDWDDLTVDNDDVARRVDVWITPPLK